MRSTALQILALWTIAIVQPSLDLLGRSPEFFVAHRATPGDIWLLLAAFMLLPPLTLVAAVWLASLAGERAARWTLLVIVGGFAAVLVVQVLGRLGVDEWLVAAAMAVGAGVAAASIFNRSPLARFLVSVLSISVIVVPAVFVTRPGVRSLTRPSQRAVPGMPEANRARHPVPVVVVVFDELPLLSLLDGTGTLDGQLYPHFTAVARDGVWFRNATTVSGYTRWALPAIVTGQYPRLESVPSPADHPNSLFTLLAASHTLEVIEAVTDLCPLELCTRESAPRETRLRNMATDLGVVVLHTMATPDLRDRLPDVTRTWAGFVADLDAPFPRTWQARWQQADSTNPAEIRRRPEVLRRFIAGIGGSDQQPALYFLHSLITHSPYGLLPSGQISVTRRHLPGPSPTAGIEDDWAIAQQHQRHLLQVGFVDGLVGRLADRLQSEGLYDRSLVILTADHGVAYSAGQPLRNVTDANAAEVMRIPLLIKFPNTTNVEAQYPRDRDSGLRVSDRNVETIDIVPTVADVVGARLGWQTDGVSLLRPDPKRSTKRLTDLTRSYEYGPDGPPLGPALQRKLALFDGASNAYRLPQPTAFGELVGRRVTAFPVESSTERIEIDEAWRFVDVDSRAPAVPFDMSGRLLGNVSGGSRRYLAIATNGVIRAITTTWKSRPREWAATLPLDVWQPGRNHVEVFAIEGASDRPLLRRLDARNVRLGELNLVTGEAELLWGVRMHGFYRSEGTPSAAFRWTRGQARLIVPRAGARPHTLRLTIARAALPNARLRVAINECTLFDGPLTAREWERAFSLDRCALEGDEFRITLASDVGTGSGGDRRPLGVAVRSVVLQD